VPTKTNRSASSNRQCGAGESGTVGALPAVMNAVNNAPARIGAPESLIRLSGSDSNL